MQHPERTPAQFYVEAEGHAWGPYSAERLAGFVAEGRVRAETLLSASPAGPFSPASSFGFAGTIGAAPAARELNAAPDAPGAARPLVVFAALDAMSEEALEGAMAAYGAHQWVRPGLWVIRARMGPAALRNALSRRLRGSDTLLVIEAPLEQAAWFNLDQAQERALRQLWAG